MTYFLSVAETGITSVTIFDENIHNARKIDISNNTIKAIYFSNGSK